MLEPQTSIMVRYEHTHPTKTKTVTLIFVVLSNSVRDVEYRIGMLFS